jgi:hypothetical protein
MPLINAMVWIFINEVPEVIHRNILPYFVSMPLPVSGRLMGFAVAMVPTGVAMFGAFFLMRLFQLYEHGHIFQASNVRCFKILSRVLIWWFAVAIVTRTLLGVVLTIHHPPGQRILSITLGSPDLTVLLIGCILAVIAWVMEEGRTLQEEQELTI